MKKLYLIEQNTNTGYDTYDSAVVCAESEDDARKVNPGGFYKWHDDAWYFQFSGREEERDTDDTWCEPSLVSVHFLGNCADKKIKVGEVICKSFNAG